jgi:4-diphosphocytidyl-2-C-methyl-D-erythritol kinase
MIKSFSKINLSLKVIKKLPNKLHEIQSNIILLNLYDEIKVNKTEKKKDIIIFKGKFNKFVNKKKNSVTESLKILRSCKIINSYYKIIINKKIPVFSGLGGGTANAASIFNFFIKKKNNSILKMFEKKIGSDFRLFFNKQSYQVSLQKLINYNRKYNLFFVLVYPNLKCSTKEIYSKVYKYSAKSRIDFSKLKSKRKFLELMKNEQNDLQELVIKKFPAIEKIINFINIQKGCSFARMTGSGSVCFGVFNSQRLAKAALARVKKKYAAYWCKVSRTI